MSVYRARSPRRRRLARAGRDAGAGAAGLFAVCAGAAFMSGNTTGALILFVLAIMWAAVGLLFAAAI